MSWYGRAGRAPPARSPAGCRTARRALQWCWPAPAAPAAPACAKLTDPLNFLPAERPWQRIYNRSRDQVEVEGMNDHSFCRHRRSAAAADAVSVVGDADRTAMDRL